MLQMSYFFFSRTYIISSAIGILVEPERQIDEEACLDA